MLTITISPFKGAIITADGRRMSVYPAFIDRRKKIVGLNECSNIGWLNSVELLMARQTGPSWTKRKIDISPELNKGIVCFLNHFHRRLHVWFDCYAFANLVSGLPRHAKQFAIDHWELTRIWGESGCGKTVFLTGPDGKTFLHAAIYLGRHRYISVYGAGGMLEISNLPDMMREFGAVRTYLATPRK